MQYAGGFVSVWQDNVTLPNGKSAKRDVVRHPGAAAVLALPSKNSLLLEWQYRHTLRRHLWEIPAGKLEAGEPPLACAKRELQEETGYAAKRWRALPAIATSPGFSDETIFLFVAEGLRYVGENPDSGEFLLTREFAICEVKNMIAAGKIIDAKTIAALYWLLAAPPPGG